MATTTTKDLVRWQKVLDVMRDRLPRRASAESKIELLVEHRNLFLECFKKPTAENTALIQKCEPSFVLETVFMMLQRLHARFSAQDEDDSRITKAVYAATALLNEARILLLDDQGETTTLRTLTKGFLSLMVTTPKYWGNATMVDVAVLFFGQPSLSESFSPTGKQMEVDRLLPIFERLCKGALATDLNNLNRLALLGLALGQLTAQASLDRIRARKTLRIMLDQFLSRPVVPMLLELRRHSTKHGPFAYFEQLPDALLSLQYEGCDDEVAWLLLHFRLVELIHVQLRATRAGQAVDPLFRMIRNFMRNLSQSAASLVNHIAPLVEAGVPIVEFPENHLATLHRNIDVTRELLGLQNVECKDLTQTLTASTRDPPQPSNNASPIFAACPFDVLGNSFFSLLFDLWHYTDKCWAPKAIDETCRCIQNIARKSHKAAASFGRNSSLRIFLMMGFELLYSIPRLTVRWPIQVIESLLAALVVITNDGPEANQGLHVVEAMDFALPTMNVLVDGSDAMEQKRLVLRPLLTVFASAAKWQRLSIEQAVMSLCIKCAFYEHLAEPSLRLMAYLYYHSGLALDVNHLQVTFIERIVMLLRRNMPNYDLGLAESVCELLSILEFVAEREGKHVMLDAHAFSVPWRGYSSAATEEASSGPEVFTNIFEYLILYIHEALAVLEPSNKILCCVCNLMGNYFSRPMKATWFGKPGLGEILATAVLELCTKAVRGNCDTLELALFALSNVATVPLFKRDLSSMKLASIRLTRELAEVLKVVDVEEVGIHILACRWIANLANSSKGTLSISQQLAIRTWVVGIEADVSSSYAPLGGDDRSSSASLAAYIGELAFCISSNKELNQTMASAVFNLICWPAGGIITLSHIVSIFRPLDKQGVFVSLEAREESDFLDNGHLLGRIGQAYCISQELTQVVEHDMYLDEVEPTDSQLSASNKRSEVEKTSKPTADDASTLYHDDEFYEKDEAAEESDETDESEDTPDCTSDDDSHLFGSSLGSNFDLSIDEYSEFD